jgi:hypothetical protein
MTIFHAGFRLISVSKHAYRELFFSQNKSRRGFKLTATLILSIHRPFLACRADRLPVLGGCRGPKELEPNLFLREFNESLLFGG